MRYMTQDAIQPRSQGPLQPEKRDGRYTTQSSQFELALTCRTDVKLAIVLVRHHQSER